MKKFILTFIVIALIFLTTLIKNSTKNIDKKIFETRENILLLEDKYKLILLDYNYLSSPSKLMELHKVYFDQELIQRDVANIQILELNNEWKSR